MTNTAAAQTSKDSTILITNSLILLSRRVALWVVSGILVLFLPRYLGDAGLGQLAFAQSFAALFTTVLSLGVSQYLVKEIARRHSLINTHLSIALGLRIAMAIVVIGAVIGVLKLTSYTDSAKHVIYIATATAIALSFVLLLRAVVHGLEEMTWPAISEVVSRLIVLAVGIPVLVMGLGVAAYASVLLAATLVDLALNTGYIGRRFSLRISFNFTRAKSLVVGGAPFLFMGFLLDVYNQTDTVVLRMFTSDAVVGWYAAANHIYKTIDMLPLALTSALLPTLSRLHVSDNRVVSATPMPPFP